MAWRVRICATETRPSTQMRPAGSACLDLLSAPRSWENQNQGGGQARSCLGCACHSGYTGSSSLRAGPRRCARAPSSSGEWALPSKCSAGFSVRQALSPRSTGSRVQSFRSCGTRA